MPTTLIHLKIGYEYAQKHKKYDNPKFYLGLIVPDAVNLHGFAEKEKRWPAHKRAKNLEEWKQNILDFYNESLIKFDESYIKGYYIHVLTDILFDEINPTLLFPKINEKFGERKSSEEYSNQMDLYECSQLDEPWWKYVKKQLNESIAETINNIDKKDIEAWKQLSIEKYNNKNKQNFDLINPQYINKIIQMLENK